MENEYKPQREKTTRKQITFDLSDKKLKIFYPKPKYSLNPKYYNKAWGDIARFMKKNGFEHRQRSVYASLKPMTRAEVLILVDSMVEKMPWLNKCLNAIDVTNIGRQHSLMQAIENSAIRLETLKKEKTEH
jgi:virulence-associated protein VapD